MRYPVTYRVLHRNHAKRLQKLDWSDEVVNPFYLTAKNLIAPNIEERRPDMGTACAFPNWWETFVLIGTNGGGDYYSLRLDNTAGIWLIGSDCGETPTRVAKTLLQYVKQSIAEREAAKASEAERVRRRKPFQEEIDAHLTEATRERGPLMLVPPRWGGAGSPFAAEWMTCGSIYAMFEWLKEVRPKISPRKLRLYGLALCGLIPGLEDDADWVSGLALAKAMTLGTAGPRRITKMRSRLRSKLEHTMENYESFEQETYGKILWRTQAVYRLFQDDEAYSSDADICPNDPELAHVYDAAGYAISRYQYGVEQAPELLREVLGNPFCSAPVMPRWRTPEVLNLARTIFRDERFDRLPELAPILAEAGCADERILSHCRRPDDYVPGCWVVDAILEKM